MAIGNVCDGLIDVNANDGTVSAHYGLITAMEQLKNKAKNIRNNGQKTEKACEFLLDCNGMLIINHMTMYAKQCEFTKIVIILSTSNQTITYGSNTNVVGRQNTNACLSRNITCDMNTL